MLYTVLLMTCHIRLCLFQVMILMDSLQAQLSSDSLAMVLVFYQIIHCSLYVDVFVLLGYETYQMER